MAINLGSLIESKTIPAHQGGTGVLRKGQYLKIVDVEGEQVADFVAVKRGDPTEFLDCVYTSWDLGRYKWKVGDEIRTNLMNAMWTIAEDTVRDHYTGGGFCSRAARQRYLNGNSERGCRDVIQDEYRANGFDPNLLQSVSCFNIFMGVEYAPSGEWKIYNSPSKQGDYIVLRAEMDLTWMVSVCAWPEVVNGSKPSPLRFETYSS